MDLIVRCVDIVGVGVAEVWSWRESLESASCGSEASSSLES